MQTVLTEPVRAGAPPPAPAEDAHVTHPVWCHFRDAALEAAFQEHNHSRAVVPYDRVMFPAVLFSFLAFLAIDHVAVPDAFGAALLLRLGPPLLVRLLAVTVAWTRYPRAAHPWLSLVISVALLVEFFTLGLLQGGTIGWLYVSFGAAVTVVAPPLGRWSVRVALGFSGAALAAVVAIVALRADATPGMQVFLPMLFANTMVFGTMASHRLERSTRESFFQRRLAEAERARSEWLLLNILPPPIADRLRDDERIIADEHAEVTVLFADLVGFTPLSKALSPTELVALLNELFTRFDELAERHGVEKIKTIGDAFMGAAGLPGPRADHVGQAVAMAVEMIDTVAAFNAERGHSLQLRVGVHTGPVVAGVIGKRKFIYDVWGETVNLAARMESHGVAGAVQVTEAVAVRLGPRADLEPQGEILVKGVGAVRTWLLRP